MGKTLFISYCWNDGSLIADDLQGQFKEFDIHRDKTYLSTNDDMEKFMSDIASCDIIVAVITEKYLKSRNCMHEICFLLDQPDWEMKSFFLIIDDNFYNLDYQLELLTYWRLKRDRCGYGIKDDDDEATPIEIIENEKEVLNEICNKLVTFFGQVKKRKNPSQITVVSDVREFANRSISISNNDICLKEEEIVNFLASSKDGVSLNEIVEATGNNYNTVRRLLQNLMQKNTVMRNGSMRSSIYAIKPK